MEQRLLQRKTIQFNSISFGNCPRWLGNLTQRLTSETSQKGSHACCILASRTQRESQTAYVLQHVDGLCWVVLSGSLLQPADTRSMTSSHVKRKECCRAGRTHEKFNLCSQFRTPKHHLATCAVHTQNHQIKLLLASPRRLRKCASAQLRQLENN